MTWYQSQTATVIGSTREDEGAAGYLYQKCYQLKSKLITAFAQVKQQHYQLSVIYQCHILNKKRLHIQKPREKPITDNGGSETAGQRRQFDIISMIQKPII